GEWGIRDSTWDDLDVVDHWRRFLDDPRRYTRYFDEE
ncbi:AAA family ATPase, partial [Burkholderia multivorans]